MLNWCYKFLNSFINKSISVYLLICKSFDASNFFLSLSCSLFYWSMMFFKSKFSWIFWLVTTACFFMSSSVYLGIFRMNWSFSFTSRFRLLMVSYILSTYLSFYTPTISIFCIFVSNCSHFNSNCSAFSSNCSICSNLFWRASSKNWFSLVNFSFYVFNYYSSSLFFNLTFYNSKIWSAPAFGAILPAFAVAGRTPVYDF